MRSAGLAGGKQRLQKPAPGMTPQAPASASPFYGMGKPMARSVSKKLTTCSPGLLQKAPSLA